MKVIDPPTMKRLVVEMPEAQHRAIKANALLEGVSIRAYVLEKLNNEPDMEDLTDALTQSLQEVADHKQGKRKLGTAREFFNSI